ncbi:hypothetical protein C1D09_003605 [Mesorhizobium intechi]|uniref:Uncharacterized protein n=1 Tax=Mesorhizobium intechi TaxID=537601 RepID=A0A8T9AZS5_9HYPH|nr:hypothetical protein [Mesorhizobium intechi]TSE13482.1 hypothetical protein C1D09_003605 [Mesorhizobium intechi]
MEVMELGGADIGDLDMRSIEHGRVAVQNDRPIGEQDCREQERYGATVPLRAKRDPKRGVSGETDI